MEFALLGPLQVTADGDQLALGGPKLRALLAILACNANAVVPVDQLVEALWEDTPPRTASQNLRLYVHRLRRILGSDERILWRAPGYHLRVRRGELDSEVFEELLILGRQALAGAPAQAASLLRQALAMWRGPALAGLHDIGSLRSTVAKLDELRLLALESRVTADLLLGRHGDLVGELALLAARHPLREHFRVQLMLALHRSGRRAEALEVYRQARAVLVNEVGVEPGPELQRLHQAILTDAVGAVEPAPVPQPRPPEETVGVLAAHPLAGSGAPPAIAGGAPWPAVGDAAELVRIWAALGQITQRLNRIEDELPLSPRRT